MHVVNIAETTCSRDVYLRHSWPFIFAPSKVSSPLSILPTDALPSVDHWPCVRTVGADVCPLASARASGGLPSGPKRSCDYRSRAGSSRVSRPARAAAEDRSHSVASNAETAGDGTYGETVGVMQAHHLSTHQEKHGTPPFAMELPLMLPAVTSDPHGVAEIIDPSCGHASSQAHRSKTL